MKKLVSAIPNQSLFNSDGDINHLALCYAIQSLKQQAGVQVSYEAILEDLLACELSRDEAQAIASEVYQRLLEDSHSTAR